MTERLDRLFLRLRNEDRGGLSVYLPAGFPDARASLGLMDAAVEGGADWLEVGFPFSDPVADGPDIQEASARALAGGTTVTEAFGIGRDLREAHPGLPLVAMTYANIAHRQGWDFWAASLHNHGFDGCILPDVPLEESGPVREALAAHELAWIPLVTPTTPPERMARIAATATGFLYVVATVGTTGQTDPGPLVEQTVQRAQAAEADVPLAVGFGIGSAEDVRRVLDAGADGAIVGSHVVRQVLAGGGTSEVRRTVTALATGTART